MNAKTAPIDPKKVKLLATVATPGTLYALALDEARRRLYGAGSDGGLYVIDLKAEKLDTATRKATLHDNYVSSLVLRDDELISGGYDGRIVWSDAEGKRVRAVTAHDGWVRKLALTPDGKQVVSVGDDMLVRVHDAASGKLTASLPGHERLTPEGYLSALYAVAVSPDGKHAASGDRAGFVRLWDLAAGKAVASFRAKELYTFDAVKRARAIGGVRGLAFSPDGQTLAVSGIGPVTNVDGFVGPCRVELWDWKACKRTAVAQDRHQAILNHVAYGPKGAWLVAAGGGDGGGAIVLWDLKSAPAVVKPKGHLQAFVCDAAGETLYAAGHGGFQVWKLRDPS
jgi:WD40 repeat protein